MRLTFVCSTTYVCYLELFHFTLLVDDLLSQPTSNPQGAIVASMPAGSFVGALAVTKLADWMGRKKTIILSGIVWVIGSILQAAAQVTAQSFRVDHFELR